MLRAVTKAAPLWQEYAFWTGDLDEDSVTKSKVLALIKACDCSGAQVFNENELFVGESSRLLSEFRDRFRTVTRILDCVGCDKCRLWGKLQSKSRLKTKLYK